MYDVKTLELNKILDTVSGYAKTKYAKACIQNLEFPSTYQDVIRMQGETKNAFDAIVKISDLPLGGLYDIKESILRAKAYGILNEEELLNVVGLIDTGSNVEKYFKSLDTIKLEYPFLKPYVADLHSFQSLKTNITLAISPEGRVLDNASKELFTIRRSLASLENRLRSKLQEILQTRASLLTESLIVIRDGRMCVPVKIEYKNTFKGVIHDVSSSNTTVYIEPEATLETANQIDNFHEKEKKEIQIILKNLSLLVASEADELLENLENLTSLDIIYAKALYGHERDYYPATVIDEQKFNIKKCKHPLIDPIKCVPIDVELGNKYSVIIITGPNTGGKTVALKTIGLAHMMSYLGLMVPASKDSIFGYFDSIVADIGDEQSIEQSLSTFSSHMTKLVNILNDISFKSLVLLDELGSGTDPKEGSSLAIAIIEYLKSTGAKVISTTHYSELKTYAYNTKDIINASVEFNTETLMPTYKLLIGVPGKSNAIEIASRLGLNSKIIEESKRQLQNNKTESSELIGNLEEEMTSLRHKEEELEHKIETYEGMINQLKLEKLDLVKKTDKIINDAKKEANNIINDAKEEATSLISEIKVMSSEAFKEHELADLKHKVSNLNVKDTEVEVFDEELNEGDFVYVKPYDKYGTISKIKKNKYTVNIGQFSMDFQKSELQLSAKPVAKKKKETKLSGYNPTSHCALSLDLRGKRVEEVSYLMDQYLDQALLGNLSSVTIIHGFGTGAVRKAVQDYLKNCSFVKSYRYGQEGEGLNGVTVVYLK